MLNKRFEAYKIRREVRRSGISCLFKRHTLNEFKEPTEDDNVLGSVLGLYHESNNNIAISTGDTTQTRTKKIPMVLCLWEDVEPLKLTAGDFMVLNGKTFKVTGVLNIQEWSIIADISLEVVDNGQ